MIVRHDDRLTRRGYLVTEKTSGRRVNRPGFGCMWEQSGIKDALVSLGNGVPGQGIVGYDQFVRGFVILNAVKSLS